MDALGLSQRCGNGGKGIGVKCVYGEYLHLKKGLKVFLMHCLEKAFWGSFLVIHYYQLSWGFFFFEESLQSAGYKQK